MSDTLARNMSNTMAKVICTKVSDVALVGMEARVWDRRFDEMTEELNGAGHAPCNKLLVCRAQVRQMRCNSVLGRYRWVRVGLFKESSEDSHDVCYYRRSA